MVRTELATYRASLAALADPDVTTIVLVSRPETSALTEAARTSVELAALGVTQATIPEATPVHEAAQVQADLRRAGIEPFAWVVNHSFAGTDVHDPILRERGAREERYLAEVRDHLAGRVAWVPWYPDAPVGPERLRQLARGTNVAAATAALT